MNSLPQSSRFNGNVEPSLRLPVLPSSQLHTHTHTQDLRAFPPQFSNLESSRCKTPIEQVYKLGRRIGKPGFYGYAQEAFHLTTKERRAVKVIKKQQANDHTSDMFRQEIQILMSLDCPHIVKGYEFFETVDTIYLIMELCTGGELFDRIENKNRNGLTYSEQDAAAIIRQVLLALSHLHARNIAHCDIKPDNILFASQAETLMPLTPIRPVLIRG
jgi:serine/threonine protein kinase